MYEWHRNMFSNDTVVGGRAGDDGGRRRLSAQPVLFLNWDSHSQPFSVYHLFAIYNLKYIKLKNKYLSTYSLYDIKKM